MLIAWMLAGSTGKLMAAYFKPDWPEQTLFGQKIWFQVCFYTLHLCFYCNKLYETSIYVFCGCLHILYFFFLLSIHTFLHI